MEMHKQNPSGMWRAVRRNSPESDIWEMMEWESDCDREGKGYKKRGLYFQESVGL